MSLLAEYKQSLKMVEVEEVVDLVLYRPLAFLFVKLVYPTNITPNQLTVVAMLFGIAAGACLVLGTGFSYAMGAVLLVLYIAIDCADGQLARLKKNGTRVGRILDGVSDYVVEITTYLGLAAGLILAGHNVLHVWLLTIAAAMSNIVHAALVDYYRNLFLDNVLKRVSTFEADLDEFRDEYRQLKLEKGRLFQKAVLWMYFRYSTFQMRLTARKETVVIRRFAPDEYYRRNRITMRLWTFLGTSTQMSFLIVCMLLLRFEVYFLGLIIVWNLYALAVFIIQRSIDRTMQPEAAR